MGAVTQVSPEAVPRITPAPPAPAAPDRWTLVDGVWCPRLFLEHQAAIMAAVASIKAEAGERAYANLDACFALVRALFALLVIHDDGTWGPWIRGIGIRLERKEAPCPDSIGVVALAPPGPRDPNVSLAIVFGRDNYDDPEVRERMDRAPAEAFAMRIQYLLGATGPRRGHVERTDAIASYLIELLELHEQARQNGAGS
jgi:hypothetical protein